MRNITIYFILLVLISCKKDTKLTLIQADIIFDRFPEEHNVYFKKIVEYKHGVPAQLFVIDSNLIIFNMDKHNKYFFTNYSLKDKKISNKYLMRGRGPGESLGAFCSGIINKHLWVYDPILKKILVANVKNLFTSKIVKFIQYPVHVDYYMIDFIDTSQFLAIGDIKSYSKFQIVDLYSKKSSIEIGTFKNVPENIPIDGFKDAYQAFILTNQDEKRTVLAYRFTDIIEIYDMKKNRKLVSLQGEEKIDIDLKIKKRGVTNYFLKDEKTKKTFVGYASTSKYIYLAYSGQTRSDTWSYAKTIYVFDWNGNPVQKINLDDYIFTFTVSNDNHKIYAFTPTNSYLVESKLF